MKQQTAPKTVSKTTPKTARKVGSKSSLHAPEVESYLKSTFHAVAPRDDFVRSLKTRLTDPATTQRPQVSTGQLILLLMGAMAGTAILVAGVLQLVIELIGAISILRLYNRETQASRLPARE